jgi:predicted dehydrogenase
MAGKAKRIAIIGAGSRGVLNLGRKIVEKGPSLDMEVSALCDQFPERLVESKRALCEAGQGGELFLTDDYRAAIDRPDVDAVIITTPQYFHRAPLEYALERGKRIYCDKPLAHTLEDAEAMRDAWKAHGGTGVILGFTRRYENVWLRAKELIDAGEIGDVRMILLRGVIPYHTYFHKWFRFSNYSGDVLNEKSAHHFDAINWFAEGAATRISAMGGRDVYEAREGYPAFCRDCDKDCPYRAHTVAPQAPDQPVAQYASARASREPLLATDACVFSPDNDIMDHAIVNIAYDNRVKAQLFLTVAGFQTDDQETLEVVGTTGRLHLTRHPAELRLATDYGRAERTIDAKSDLHTTSHFGADYILVDEIANLFVRGIEPAVTVQHGYQATRMAALAIRSCKTGETVALDNDPA